MSPAAHDGRSGITELRVHDFSISLDGYAAGPDQNEQAPLGAGGERLSKDLPPPSARKLAPGP
ncbi:hypothetical protein [Blastococcus mobilis]|uniref:RibD C-terminal domain-containing protein n=1 Tax=Blastococcus mobilis TaxID=1938746 RepID=A0A238WRT7_9ACTN|nr:hypothetical protein [Blastococcus mobilis]SNR49242.1 hypothetical protein SAMN06272737_109115 [Blastococcus mobilis]